MTNPTRRDVVRWVSEQPYATSRDVANHFKIAVKAASSHLERASEDGSLARSRNPGGANGCRYRYQRAHGALTGIEKLQAEASARIVEIEAQIHTLHREREALQVYLRSLSHGVTVGA